MGTEKWCKKYKLNDGSIVTIDEVAKKVGCPKATAAGRIARHRDPAKLYAKWIPKGEKGCRMYLLDDGTEVDCFDVVAKISCPVIIARSRLTKSSDPAKIFAPFISKQRAEMSIENASNYTKKRIMSRGMFDDMFALAMKSI